MHTRSSPNMSKVGVQIICALVERIKFLTYKTLICICIYYIHQLQEIGETPLITLYQNNNYGGTAMNFVYEISNLKYYKFNDEVSSVKVKSAM